MIEDKYKEIEVEFGFRFINRNLKDKIRRMSREIFNLRKKQKGIDMENETTRTIIKELESKIFYLDKILEKYR